MTIHRGSGGTNGTAVDNTDFVYLTSPTTGEVLQFDATTDRFLNKTLSEAGIQPTLVSGTNIKTINGESLLGTTDIPVATPSDIGSTILAYDANLQSFVNTFTLPTVDSTNGYVLTTNGAGILSLTAPPIIADGDKGDITVTGGVWNIDAGVVTTLELGGDITTAGKALLDDATAADQRTTLGVTATGSDTTYNYRANNLSDVANAATAFTNIKQAASTTATGVVEKATTAEAQAYTTDKFIDGALLALALQGANQSLTTNGYQKLPGGLIIQWGYISSAANITNTINLSVTYPTAHLAAFASLASIGSNTASNQNASTGATNFSTSQIQVRNGIGAAQNFFWFSIGY